MPEVGQFFEGHEQGRGPHPDQVHGAADKAKRHQRPAAAKAQHPQIKPHAQGVAGAGLPAFHEKRKRHPAFRKACLFQRGKLIRTRRQQQHRRQPVRNAGPQRRQQPRAGQPRLRPRPDDRGQQPDHQIARHQRHRCPAVRRARRRHVAKGPQRRHEGRQHHRQRHQRPHRQQRGKRRMARGKDGRLRRQGRSHIGMNNAGGRKRQHVNPGPCQQDHGVKPDPGHSLAIPAGRSARVFRRYRHFVPLFAQVLRPLSCVRQLRSGRSRACCVGFIHPLQMSNN